MCTRNNRKQVHMSTYIRERERQKRRYFAAVYARRTVCVCLAHCVIIIQHKLFSVFVCVFVCVQFVREWCCASSSPPKLLLCDAICLRVSFAALGHDDNGRQRRQQRTMDWKCLNYCTILCEYMYVLCAFVSVICEHTYIQVCVCVCVYIHTYLCWSMYCWLA